MPVQHMQQLKIHHISYLRRFSLFISKLFAPTTSKQNVLDADKFIITYSKQFFIICSNRSVFWVHIVSMYVYIYMTERIRM